MTPSDQQRRAVAVAIESLRRERRSAWRGRHHPEGKRFTQEELRDVAPVFKNFYLGRTRRLPQREHLIAIAAHLECSHTEQNELLQLAGYLPEPWAPEPDNAPWLYDAGRTILHTLPLPAALIAPGWFEVAVNAPYLARYGDCPDAFWRGRTGAAIPWYFDPALAAITCPTPAPALQRANQEQILRLFRRMHHGLTQAPWYHSLVREYHEFPAFAAAWAATGEVQPVPPGVTSQLLPDSTAIFAEQQLPMLVSPDSFPLIVVSVPIDAAARALYRERGVALTETQWEAQLADKT